MNAILAVAASMLTAASHILRHQVPYRELASRYFDSLDRNRLTRRLVRRLESLGLSVQIQEAA
jgi:transposase